MLIIWRGLLLAVLHLAVLVCFPDYTPFAPVTVFIVFLISMAVVIAATGLFSAMGANKSFAGNRFMEVVFLIIVAIILLMAVPQKDNTSPFDKVKNGRYPTKSDINRGLAKFGIKGLDKDVQKALDSTANSFNYGLNEAKSVVNKQEWD